VLWFLVCRAFEPSLFLTFFEKYQVQFHIFCKSKRNDQVELWVNFCQFKSQAQMWECGLAVHFAVVKAL
jgi:tRNA pseudouridine-54 N-methylase